MTTTTPVEPEVRGDLRQLGTVLIIAGVLGTIAGILALVFPDITLLALALIAGINLLLLGALSLVDSFSDDGDTGARVLSAVLGLLGIMAGLVVMRRPGESLLAVLLVLGIWLVVTGIVDLVRAFASAAGSRVPAAGRGVDLVLGALILALPDVSLKTLALLIGIAFMSAACCAWCGAFRAAPRGPGMIEGHLEEYRELRSRLEERILAIATSIDGRRFELQAPLQGLELPPGGYAMLEDDGGATARPGARACGSSSSTPPRWGGRRRAGRACGAQPAGDPRGERRGRDPVRRRRAVPRRHDPRRRRPTRSPPGSARAPGAARGCRSASCGCRRACRSRSTPAASTATRSSAASPAPARPTRSASCSSSCCWRRACGS